jgi:hypothetical protein
MDNGSGESHTHNRQFTGQTAVGDDSIEDLDGVE